MDEPCDWDVCTEASTVSQQLLRTEKKRRSKPEASVSEPVEDQAVKQRCQTKAARAQAGPRMASHGEEITRRTSCAGDASQQGSSRATPTRKELQDALPKIPPLSSFKSCRTRFMTFEEAQRDFQTFITTGLGRSVEVIREFRGEDQNVYKEYITLHDDGAQDLALNGVQLQSDVSPRSSVSGSSNSPSDMDIDTTPRGSNQPTDAEHRPPVKPQPDSTSTAQNPSVPIIHNQPSRAASGGVLPPPESRKLRVKASTESSQTAPRHTYRETSKKVKKESSKLSGKMKEEPERDKGEERMDTEEEEWSSEAYWRACYRAWSDYYSSMHVLPEQRYQSCYGAAHNWMAAYRMNAVYMHELMKH